MSYQVKKALHCITIIINNDSIVLICKRVACIFFMFDFTLFFSGVVRQVKPLVGPLSTVLKLAMNYVTNGVISHRNIIKVHIYVSEFWF